MLSLVCAREKDDVKVNTGGSIAVQKPSLYSSLVSKPAPSRITSREALYGLSSLSGVKNDTPSSFSAKRVAGTLSVRGLRLMKLKRNSVLTIGLIKNPPKSIAGRGAKNTTSELPSTT